MHSFSKSSSGAEQLSVDERWGVSLLTAICFLAILLLASGDNAVGLAVTLSYGISTPLLLLTSWGRRALRSVWVLMVLGLLFGLTVLASVLSLTPVGFDPPHWAWRLVNEPSTPSIDRSRTILELLKLLGLASIFTSGMIMGARYERAKYFLRTIALLSFLFSFWAFTAFIAAPATIMGFGSSAWTNRLVATFASANTAGTFFGMIVILGAGLLMSTLGGASQPRFGRSNLETTLWQAAMPSGLVLIAATALLLTGSRTAILMTAAVLILFVLLEGVAQHWRFRTTVLVLTPAMVLAGAVLLLVSGATFFQRMTAIQADAASRATIYAMNIQAMKPFPFFGFGLGSFEVVHRQLIDAEHFGSLWNIRAMHDVYLQWRQGAGYLGSISMFLCVAICLLWIGRGAASRRKPATYLRAILAMSTIVLLHGLTDFALEEFSFAGFWALLLGCGLALSMRGHYKNTASPKELTHHD